MNPARIAELLEPFVNSQDQRPNTQNLIQDISTYIDILLRWNARVNLTAIRDPEQIVTRHFGESLFAARHLFPDRFASSASSAVRDFDVDFADHPKPKTSRQKTSRQKTSDRLADLGSGAGFPGLPIKLYVPHIHLTLIESSHKKSTFLREVARALTLTGINILTARAETVPAEAYDVVTLRAVERFASILPAAARLVDPGGRIALLIGAAQETQARAILPTLTWHAPLPIPQSSSRVLLIASRKRSIPEPKYATVE